MLTSTIASMFDGNFPVKGRCKEVFEYAKLPNPKDCMMFFS